MSFITTPHGLRTSILVFHSFIHSFIDSMLVHNKSCNGMETAQPRHLTLDHIPFPSLYFTPLHFNLLTSSFDKNESLIMQCSRCGAVRCDAVFRALPIFHLEHYTCALFFVLRVFCSTVSSLTDQINVTSLSWSRSLSDRCQLQLSFKK